MDKNSREKKDNNVHPTLKKPPTVGQRAADKITKWAGSWTFILSFTLFLVLWVIVNTTWMIFRNTWDPYPFILLNLILSCLAAFQAPIILMSQNRESERDRQRAEYDYAVNRRAEREIKEIKKLISRVDRKLSPEKK
jgi:uncharacterized membrane protein